MLQITVPGQEYWDTIKQQFVYTKEQTLQLEHSLVSLSKWESKWGKSFLHSQDKTDEEILDYIRCMTITQNVKPEVYSRLSQDNIRDINDYINAPMTATTFSKDKGGKRSREIVTAEVIYYWMVALNIPPQYEKWHLNKLITLIRVCEDKNNPKKMSKKDIYSRNAAINARNRAKYKSKG
jgi:hypothetical protein